MREFLLWLINEADELKKHVQFWYFVVWGLTFVISLFTPVFWIVWFLGIPIAVLIWIWTKKRTK